MYSVKNLLEDQWTIMEEKEIQQAWIDEFA